MPSASDRNLIVGLLAFQLDFVSKDGLVSAMGTWAAEKSKTLEDVFLEAQLIDRPTHQLLASLAQKRLEQTDSANGSLLKPTAEVESIRDELVRLDDAEIDQSLNSLLPGDLSTRRDLIEDKTTGSTEPTLWETLEARQDATSPENRFRVIRPHAKGGLGEVSIAMDGELNRQVALKQMQARFADDAEARQRFVIEAEVTGGLEHPGIVPVYGLGRYADGRPYYAMRFIRGESLREASDRYHGKFGTTQHSTDQILELRKLLNAFRDVCQTIEYAHSSHVLHRDLKPDNIMLGPFGETLVVDWGLAKIEGTDTEINASGEPRDARGSRSSATVMGSVVGTPAFMSPEQAKGLIDRISPASDVYSLGATLYYVLCGKSPFAVDSVVDKSSAEVGKVLQRVGRGEFVRPRELNAAIPKPLAAICLKAMALEPGQRYSSAAQLGDDIERYLADEPILALADSALDRARRWMRNHQTLTMTAGTLLVASAIGMSLFSSMLAAKQQELELTNQELIVAEQQALESAEAAEERRREAEEQRRQAELAREQAEEARSQAELAQAAEKEAKADALAFSDFLVNNILAAARPKDVGGGLGIDVTVVDAIQAAEEDLSRVFETRPRAEAIARQGIGDTWYALGEYQRAAAQLAQAEVLYQQVFGADHLDTIIARSGLALARAHLGELDEAIRIQREIVSSLERLLGPTAKETLSAISNLALSYMEKGDYQQGLPRLKDVYELSREHLGQKDPATLRSMNNYADALRYADDDQKRTAIEMLEQLIVLNRQVLGTSHPDALKTTNNLATLYQEVGESQKSIEMLDQTLAHMTEELGEDHPTTLVTQTNLAFAHVQAGLYQPAIELLNKVVEQSSSKLSAEHPSTLNAIDILASTYDAAGQLDQAIKLYRRALSGRERVLGREHADTLTTKNNLALAYLQSGDAPTAVPLFESVLEIRQRKLAPGDARLLLSMDNLAAAYIAIGQAERALPLYRELAGHPPEDLQTKWRLQNNLADAYVRTEQPAAAIRVWQPLLEEMEQVLEPGDSSLETVRQGLAIAHLRVGEFDQAKTLFQAAVERQRSKFAESKLESDQSMIRGLLVYLALCQLATGEAEAAEASASESARIARRLMPDDWRRFNAESIWGAALLRLGRTAEAAGLLEVAHTGLLDQHDALPLDLKLEFVVPSFDRLIELYRTQQQADKLSEIESQKDEFLRRIGRQD